TAVADFISTLGPASAGSELFRRSINLQFGGSAAILVPSVVSSANDVSFVGEGQPIPVRQLLIGGPTLTPSKFAVIFTLLRRLVEYSTPNAEQLTRAVLTESAGAALDAALFDANASSATRPAGLRNGVAALTATSGGGDVAMIADLGKLAAAVSAVAGSQIA